MWIIHGWCLQLQSWKQWETWEGPGLKWGLCWLKWSTSSDGHRARHIPQGAETQSHQHQYITSAQSSLHPHRRAVSSSATEHQVTRGDPQLDWSALLFAKPASSSFSLLMPYCPSSWKNLASVVGTFKRFPKVNDLGLFEAFCRVNCKQFLPLWRCFPRPKTNIWDCWFMCAVDPPHWDWRNAQTPGDEWHLEWAANLFSFHGMLA